MICYKLIISIKILFQELIKLFVIGRNLWQSCGVVAIRRAVEDELVPVVLVVLVKGVF